MGGHSAYRWPLPVLVEEGSSLGTSSFPGWHPPACLFSRSCVLIKFFFLSSVCPRALRFGGTVGYSSTKAVPQVFHQIASNRSPFKALRVFA